MLPDATSISIANTMPAEGYGHSFMNLNDTVEIQCRNGMRMSPDLADSRRTVTCSTNNTWIVDRSFECVPSKSQTCVLYCKLRPYKKREFELVK